MSTLSNNYSFTKIVVDDLDRTADFYKAVFDYKEFQRVQSDVAGEPMSEIIMVKGASMEGDLPLVIWKWPRRPAPASSDVILGFMTSNVDELVARVPAAGGRIIQAPKDDPEHGVRVGFVADVDGRLIEVVQMLQG